MKDPAQILEAMRDVLVAHMKNPNALPEYRIQRAILIGKNSGRMIGDDQIGGGSDVPGGLRITMESGDEYELTLT